MGFGGLCRWLERDKVSLGAYFPSGWDLVVLVLHARACNNARGCERAGAWNVVGIRLPSPHLGGAGREVACTCCIARARRLGFP